jgi:hypothetical protein
MRSVIGWAVPCGPRSIKYEDEEKVIDVACDERTIFACFAEDGFYLKSSDCTKSEIRMFSVKLLFQFVQSCRCYITHKASKGSIKQGL